MLLGMQPLRAGTHAPPAEKPYLCIGVWEDVDTATVQFSSIRSPLRWAVKEPLMSWSKKLNHEHLAFKAYGEGTTCAGVWWVLGVGF